MKSIITGIYEEIKNRASIAGMLGAALKDAAAVQRRANSFARSQGYGRADVVHLAPEPVILDRTEPGYRKYTTDEYVCHAYRSNFGWKNTYYENAFTAVGLPVI